MIIAGAGGHGLEVLEVLLEKQDLLPALAFYDQDTMLPDALSQRSVIKSLDLVKVFFEKSPLFTLGVGHPSSREKLDGLLSEIGGELISIQASTSVVQSPLNASDVMSFGFVGPQVRLGRGILVNTRASVHHECEVGDYTEIGPGAILLGKVKVGKKCRIGAGAVILPGIELGDEVVVGAGAVVTKAVRSKMVVVGVPAQPIP